MKYLLMHFNDLLALGVREYALVIEVIHEIRLEIKDRFLLFLDSRHLEINNRCVSDYRCMLSGSRRSDQM